MRILYLCPRLPYPPDRGDRIRNYQSLRSLASRHDVTLVCFQDRESEGEIRALRSMVTSLVTVPLSAFEIAFRGGLGLLKGLPFHVAYYQSGAFEQTVRKLVQEQNFDLIVASLIRMAPYCDNSGVPVLLDLTDSLALNYRQRADFGSGLVKLFHRYEAYATARYERWVTERFRYLLICSESDKAFVVGQNPKADPHVLPNGVNAEYFRPEPGETSPATFMFMGTMDYFANVAAVQLFAQKILPTIRATLPDAQFVIVGRDPAPEVQALTSMPGVTVTGRVPDVRPFLRSATALVAPMEFGTGTQNKVLEAMAAGVPVITTSPICKALRFAANDGLLVADEWQAFADLAVRLCHDRVFWEKIAARGRDLVTSHYSLDAVSADLLRVVEATVPTGEGPR